MKILKKLINYFCIFSFLLFTHSCRYEQQALNENDKDIIVKEIKSWMSEVVEAEESLDVNRVLENYSNTENFVWCGDGKITSDYSIFKEGLKRNLQQIEKFLNGNINNENIAVLSKDAAAYSFSFDWSLLTIEGDTLNSKGSWTYVLKKFDGKWKSVHCNGTHNYY